MSRIDFTDAKAGIHSIDHFALTVPDLATSAEFLRTFGLRVEETREMLRVRTELDDHVWALILPGERKCLGYISVACYADDFQALVRQITDAGGLATEPHPAAAAGGYWFRDPHGMLVQLNHLLAFARSGGIGLRHSSWGVPNIDDVGRGNSQMRAAGHPDHWGPGRHVLGSNYFNYVMDPFRRWWEHSCHIDYIEKGARWESTTRRRKTRCICGVRPAAGHGREP